MTKSDMIEALGNKLGPRAAVADVVDALKDLGVLLVEGDEPAKAPEAEPAPVKRKHK